MEAESRYWNIAEAFQTNTSRQIWILKDPNKTEEIYRGSSAPYIWHLSGNCCKFHLFSTPSILRRIENLAIENTA